jgi:hypothetical protein
LFEDFALRYGVGAGLGNRLHAGSIGDGGEGRGGGRQCVKRMLINRFSQRRLRRRLRCTLRRRR